MSSRLDALLIAERQRGAGAVPAWLRPRGPERDLHVYEYNLKLDSLARLEHAGQPEKPQNVPSGVAARFSLSTIRDRQDSMLRGNIGQQTAPVLKASMVKELYLDSRYPLPNFFGESERCPVVYPGQPVPDPHCAKCPASAWCHRHRTESEVLELAIAGRYGSVHEFKRFWYLRYELEKHEPDWQQAYRQELYPDPAPAGQPEEPGSYEDTEQIDATTKNAYLEKINAGAFVSTSLQHGLSLPLHGVWYKSCNQWIYRGCLERENHASPVGYAKFSQNHCGRLGCPKCGPSAIESRAMDITRRLLAGAMLLNSSVYSTRKKSIFNHFVVSLSESNREIFKGPAGRKKILARVRRDMKKLGFVGSVEITHPWRFTAGLAKSYWAPHLHFIAMGYIDHKAYKAKYAGQIAAGKMAADPITQMHQKTGDVYRSVRTFSDVGSVQVLAAYLLSHAGAAPGQQFYRYLGALSNTKFKTEAVLSNSSALKYDLGRFCSELVTDTAGFVQVQTVSTGAEFASELDVAKMQPGKMRTVSPENLPGLLLELAKPAQSELEDNPAIAKSTALKFALLAVWPQDKYRDKYGIKYCVLALDPDMENLCPGCHYELKVILPQNGLLDRPPDPESEPNQCHILAAPERYDYYDPRDYLYKGRPYFVAMELEQQYEDGIPHAHPLVEHLPADAQFSQRRAIEAGVARFIAKQIRSGLEPDASFKELKAAAMQHIQKHGLPSDLSTDTWQQPLIFAVWSSIGKQGPGAALAAGQQSL